MAYVYYALRPYRTIRTQCGPKGPLSPPKPFPVYNATVYFQIPCFYYLYLWNVGKPSAAEKNSKRIAAGDLSADRDCLAPARANSFRRCQFPPIAYAQCRRAMHSSRDRSVNQVAVLPIAFDMQLEIARRRNSLHICIPSLLNWCSLYSRNSNSAREFPSVRMFPF